MREEMAGGQERKLPHVWIAKHELDEIVAEGSLPYRYGEFSTSNHEWFTEPYVPASSVAEAVGEVKQLRQTATALLLALEENRDISVAVYDLTNAMLPGGKL